MITQTTEKLTQSQVTVMWSLYDVASHEGGSRTLKPRYYPAAEALIRRGFVSKQSNDFYRPQYEITEAGKEFWRVYNPNGARQSDESGRRYNETRTVKL